MRKQTAVLLIALCVLLLITSCTSKLDTSIHSDSDLYSLEQIKVDYNWRFIAYSKNKAGIGIVVKVSWDITFRDMGDWDIPFSDMGDRYLYSTYHTKEIKFTFEDKDGFLIAEKTVYDFSSVVVFLGESDKKKGNFFIYVQSVEVANNIKRMNVSFTSLTKLTE